MPIALLRIQKPDHHSNLQKNQACLTPKPKMINWNLELINQETKIKRCAKKEKLVERLP